MATRLNGLRIPIHLEERDGLPREAEPVRIGIPLPVGRVYDSQELVVTNAAGEWIPHQFAALARWGDRSIKWLLVDALVRVSPLGHTDLFVCNAAKVQRPLEARPAVSIVGDGDTLRIDTGVGQFTLARHASGPVATARVHGHEMLQSSGTRIQLNGVGESKYELDVERLTIEEHGPLRATVLAEGGFRAVNGSRGAHSLPLWFKLRTVFWAGTALLRIDLLIRNTRAALHPGGLWDLGDPGSYLFRDLTLACFPRCPADGPVSWHAESPRDLRIQHADRWSLYQDSSGGERWDSPNHLDRNSRQTVSFRGYRVISGPDGAVLAQGNRAVPVVAVAGKDTWVAAAVQGFWQNFPKALRWHSGALEVGIFPGEARAGFELQGGEQKRHTILLQFGTASSCPCLAQLQRPVDICVQPEWAEASGAIMWLSAQTPEDDPALAGYLQRIVAGDRSFFARREIIDEYGWRNFGELYADHEAVHHDGPGPFVSHYNNQYDFVYGAFLNFMRTGDARWRRLMEEAARHHIDIDIYHTQQDKAAFNGGLFWHTDHHKPAATCTHRTYSRGNSGPGDYGGGPGNEHNYTSGLLHYFYICGDLEAANSVQELADWVLALDDGARTLLGLIDSGATGGASRTVESSYHHAGRGAGNSLNALLDAYTVSRERRYLEKAQEIVQRCIHPADDIAALRLGEDPEHRWSYLIFLQILGKYLAKKREIGEIDYMFHYARCSLLHYASWMVENEVPYKDVLHKVELPTETWPAHDIRKCHVLHVAAGYASAGERQRLQERATFFFERCLHDLLTFATADLTRPLVILSVYGPVHAYYCRRAESFGEFSTHNHDFGVPNEFIPQRARLKSVMGLRMRILSAEIVRLLVDKLYVIRLRLRWPG